MGEKLQDQIINKIRKKRNELGLSQANVANALSMTAQNYQQIEAGTTQLTINRIVEIAEYFEISPLQLIQDTITFQNDFNGKIEGDYAVGYVNQHNVESNKEIQNIERKFQEQTQALQEQIEKLTQILSKANIS